MASKFTAGMQNVVQVLNEMWAAFAAGPYNALPLTGGTVNGPVRVNGSLVTDVIGSTRFVNTGNAPGWWRVASAPAVPTLEATIRIGGTTDYAAGVEPKSMETFIVLRCENDGVVRGNFYSVGGTSGNTISAVRVGGDGSVYVLTNTYFSLAVYIAASTWASQVIEFVGTSIPPGTRDIPAIFGLKCGAENTLTVTPGAIVANATITATSLGPTTDNTYAVGSSALAYSTIYARTGAINTSDARLKCGFRDLSTAEIAAARDLARAIGVYRWRDAVECKGDEAREHIGPTVQRAIEIMNAHGLDPFGYGFICHDTWERQTVEHPAVEARPAVLAVEAIPAEMDALGNLVTPTVPASPGQPAIEAREAYTEVTLAAGDRYAFRYDELSMFIAAGQEARLAALEAA